MDARHPFTAGGEPGIPGTGRTSQVGGPVRPTRGVVDWGRVLFPVVRFGLCYLILIQVLGVVVTDQISAGGFWRGGGRGENRGQPRVASCEKAVKQGKHTREYGYWTDGNLQCNF